MKIAIISGYGPSLINFRGPLIRAMISEGYEVIACSPKLGPATRKAVEEIGVAWHEIPLARTGLNPIADIKTLRYLRKLFVAEKPDIVLAYTIKSVIYGSLAAAMTGVPLVSSMITGLGYTFGSASPKQRVLGLLARNLYRVALAFNTVVFFQNPDDQALFVDTGLIQDPSKVVLINGSGVDLDHYRRVPPALNPPTFLLIARLLRDKGIYEYVDAARILKAKYPRARFHLVGPFDSNPSAISPETVNGWQAEGVITYFGETDDVRPFIADASVYVLPSYREGTPRTVLEAMAMGRPIITTDAPGCRETVIHGRNGYLVPVRDAESLASAMERFILKPHLIEFMGGESHTIACKKYDVNKVNKVVMKHLGLLTHRRSTVR